MPDGSFVFLRLCSAYFLHMLAFLFFRLRVHSRLFWILKIKKDCFRIKLIYFKHNSVGNYSNFTYNLVSFFSRIEYYFHPCSASWAYCYYLVKCFSTESSSIFTWLSVSLCTSGHEQQTCSVYQNIILRIESWTWSAK